MSNEEFDEYHSITYKLEECLLCKEAGREAHEPKRLISGGGNGRGIVQLTGKEYTDKIAADGIKMRNEIYSSERLLSNVVGEDRYQKNQTERDKR